MAASAAWGRDLRRSTSRSLLRPPVELTAPPPAELAAPPPGGCLATDRPGPQPHSRLHAAATSWRSPTQIQTHAVKLPLRRVAACPNPSIAHWSRASARRSRCRACGQSVEERLARLLRGSSTLRGRPWLHSASTAGTTALWLQRPLGLWGLRCEPRNKNGSNHRHLRERSIEKSDLRPPGTHKA
jgi:hypothetical protein